MHYEVELGLIIGKTIRDLHPDDTRGALDAISGTISFIRYFFWGGYVRYSALPKIYPYYPYCCRPDPKKKHEQENKDM